MQREYALKLVVNGRTLERVAIDDHYKLKHSDSVNDALILELVKTLNRRSYLHENVTRSGWEIYVLDPVHLKGKGYRLVWCLHPEESILGVINTYRRRSRL
jgi:hypothetical protein